MPTVDIAVRSILAQTLAELEVIAVDDGSTDGTGVRLAALAREDHRVRVLHTPGLGIVGALELARTYAAGHYLARMDADDESLPQRLALSVAALEGDPSLSGVGTQVEIFREDRPPSPNLTRYSRWLNSLRRPEDVHRECFIESPLCHPSVTLRREAVERAGGWRQGDFPEDYALWLELLAQGGRLAVVGPVLHRWRDGEGRLTRTDSRYRSEAMIDLKGRYLARLPQAAQGVLVWGAGRNGLRLARALRAHGTRVEQLIDVSPRKVGQRVDGWEVIAPDALGAPCRAHLIAAVGAMGAREEIRAHLRARGWQEGRDFTCAA